MLVWIVVLGMSLSSLACTPNRTQQSSAADTASLRGYHQSFLAFDGQQAYRLVEQQIRYGPRAPGTPGHDECRRFLRQYLSQHADTVFEQHFVQEVYGTQLKLTNIGASFRPGLTPRVLFCAHWDTRPVADEDPDPTKRSLPILGANDGGSGTAVLLELARLMARVPPPVGVDILLLDGEDYGKAFDLNNFCLGSRYAARQYPFPILPQWVIVVDLVGDREAWFPWEEYSWRSAPALLQELWSIGSQIAPERFRPLRYGAIFDDHVPFIETGLRAVLIVDAELVGNQSSSQRRRYWHTHRDQLDNITAESLHAVGQTLVNWLYQGTW